MIKIGTDICSVSRITAAYERFGQKFLQKIFTPLEIDYVLRDSAHASARIAGRFAAKEAASKALGTGWRGMSWKDVEILRSPSGEPKIHLHGRALQIAAGKGLDCFEVTISHEREYAVASVLAYKRDLK